METTASKLNKLVLNKLKKTDFMSNAVKNFFPEAKHKLISGLDITDPTLRRCYERIGYFYLPPELPVIFTHVKISLKETKKELLEDLKAQKKPYGDLLRDYYPGSKIESRTISFDENCLLPEYFNQKKQIMLSKHERYILVDDKIVAVAIEYI